VVGLAIRAGKPACVERDRSWPDAGNVLLQLVVPQFLVQGDDIAKRLQYGGIAPGTVGNAVDALPRDFGLAGAIELLKGGIAHFDAQLLVEQGNRLADRTQDL